MRSIAVVTMVLVMTGCASGGRTPEQTAAEREQLKREILAELRAEEARAPEALVAIAGTVEGRVLWNGDPLPECRVRLVRVDENVGYVAGADAAGSVVDTVTDARGTYRFDDIPAGSYKLKWVNPGGERWIRFLATEPDLAVIAGETTSFRDIEASRRAVGDDE